MKTAIRSMTGVEHRWEDGWRYRLAQERWPVRGPIWWRPREPDAHTTGRSGQCLASRCRSQGNARQDSTCVYRAYCLARSSI